MKKTLLFLALFVTFVSPVISMASTFNIATQGEFIAGQTYTVDINIEPSTTIYTSKVVVEYPANLLQAKSFTYTSNWVPLLADGYDQINNSTGVLIKTGGYPSGLSSSGKFGTIIFVARSSGSGNIAVRSDSQLLDVDNKNTYEGAKEVTINVKPDTSRPVTVKSNVGQTVTNTSLVGVAVADAATSSESVASSTQSTTTIVGSVNNTASAVGAGFSVGWFAVIIVAALLIIALIFGRRAMFR